MTFSIYLSGLVGTLFLAGLTWLVSLIKRDVSIVDSMWAVMIFASAFIYSSSVEPYWNRSSLVLTLVLLWALRLTVYITWRNWGESEDARYQAIRRKYEPNFALKSLGIIFVFQAVLAWIISMPLWVALTVPFEYSIFDTLAVTLWMIGMSFESVGDWQLARFKMNPANRGKVMNQGLWRYARHPNYFGECLIWWGFFLFVIPTGAWWSILSPILLTFLLLKFSGVTMLEETIVDRRPAYREYIASTNAFIPGPQKKANPVADHQEEIS
ncbi:MAG: membrane protein [Nitrospirales bacterium]|nr:MAG: membrane protein [Nitrospirales bacterium]